MRSKLVYCIVVISLFAVLIGEMAAGEKSDAKVKASAAAKKPGNGDKQIVTITLDIDNGWYIYANPLNANTEVLNANVTRITLKAKDKIQVAVKYPAGKQKMEDKYQYDIYQGKVIIQADVQRTMGDGSPLEVSIHVNACRKGECLLPGVIKLKVK